MDETDKTHIVTTLLEKMDQARVRVRVGIGVETLVFGVKGRDGVAERKLVRSCSHQDFLSNPSGEARRRRGSFARPGALELG